MADLTYDLCALTPTEIELDVMGPAIEGGRSISGPTKAINYTGGGLVRAIYGGIPLLTKEQHKAWSAYGAILNGSVRTVLVPLWADLFAAFGAGGPIGGPGGPSNPTAAAGVSLGGTSVSFTTGAAAVLTGGEWFSIGHGGTLEKRAYRVLTAVEAPTDTWTITFTPPLRAAISAGETLDFWRPECLMRLAPGETMGSRFSAPGGLAIVSAMFIEAF